MAEIFPFLDKNLGLLPDVAAEDVAAVKFYKEFQKVLLKSAGRTHKLVLGGFTFKQLWRLDSKSFPVSNLGDFFSLSLKRGRLPAKIFFSVPISFFFFLRR